MSQKDQLKVAGAQSINPSTREAEAGSVSEFQACLVYRESSTGGRVWIGSRETLSSEHDCYTHDLRAAWLACTDHTSHCSSTGGGGAHTAPLLTEELLTVDGDLIFFWGETVAKLHMIQWSVLYSHACR